MQVIKMNMKTKLFRLVNLQAINNEKRDIIHDSKCLAQTHNTINCSSIALLPSILTVPLLCSLFSVLKLSPLLPILLVLSAG